MKNRLFVCTTLVLLSLLRGVASAGVSGLEFRVTLSGKLLLGIGFRHQIDDNTALRLGAYTGVAGAPVGFFLGLAQDLSPSKLWTPFFQAGLDVLYYKKETIQRRISPGAALGFSYCPQTHIRHSGELWLSSFSKKMRPMGLSYVLFNSFY
jgi:hypothetical protein